MTEYNEFDTDTHRRVCAHTMRPRSANEIARELHIMDPNVDESAYTREGVENYLADLEADGLVKKVGTFNTPEDALKAQNKDKDVIDFCGSEEAFTNSANGPMGYPFLDREDHYVMTKTGHARLTGETRPGDNGGSGGPVLINPRTGEVT